MFEANWTVDGVPLAGLADVWFDDEPVGAKRSHTSTVVYRDGVWTPARAWLASSRQLLHTVLRDRDPFGPSPHPEGAVGHARQSRRLLAAMLAPAHPQTVVLARDVQDWGRVQARVLVSEETARADDPMHLVWPVELVDGVWEAATVSSVSAAGLTAGPSSIPLTVGGNYEVAPVVTFECVVAGVDPTLMVTGAGDAVTCAGSFTTGTTLVVDVAAGVATKDGVADPSMLRINRGFWMRIPPGSQSVSFTSTSGTWDVTVEWRDRFR